MIIDKDWIKKEFSVPVDRTCGTHIIVFPGG